MAETLAGDDGEAEGETPLTRGSLAGADPVTLTDSLGGWAPSCYRESTVHKDRLTH